jgi:hypothetical protein
MPSRKQRRRREKERRHEYELVYVDGEGRELELPPEEEQRRAERDRAKADGGGAKAAAPAGKGARGGTGRPVREVKPPSWTRSLKRSAIFFVVFMIFFSLVNKNASPVAHVLTALVYAALFVPLSYVMDRTAYRSYLRRSAQSPPPTGRARG